MQRIRDIIKHTDWILLIFLFLVANHAMFTLKLAGLAFIYILRPNLKFGLFKGRLPKFYLYIVVLALINLLVHVQEFSYEYLTAFAVGNSFWIFGLLIHHQLRLTVENRGDIAVVNTMRSFVLCNLAFCIYQVIKIAVITHTFDPYADLPFPYGMSTGDKVFGFFMESSYYNMMVSAMVAVYFLFKRDLLFSVLAGVCMLMVFGNVGTLVFGAVLTGIVAVSLLPKAKDDKVSSFKQILNNISIPKKALLGIPVLLVVTVFFYAVVSPSNGTYLYRKLTGEGNNDSAIVVPPPATIDVLDGDKVLLTQKALHDLKGKKLSFNETIEYLGSSPAALLLGAGTTRFSSVTAQRMSGLDSSRIFMRILPHYRSRLYENNHWLLISMRMHSAEAELSNANWPDSFYNQIFGEYGILGFILFLVFYIGFFLKDIRYWTYSFWLSIMLVPFCLISYMFEPLCAMVFFELLVIADIVNNKKLVNER